MKYYNWEINTGSCLFKCSTGSTWDTSNSQEYRWSLCPQDPDSLSGSFCKDGGFAIRLHVTLVWQLRRVSECCELGRVWIVSFFNPPPYLLITKVNFMLRRTVRKREAETSLLCLWQSPTFFLSWINLPFYPVSCRGSLGPMSIPPRTCTINTKINCGRIYLADNHKRQSRWEGKISHHLKCKLISPDSVVAGGER